MTTTVRNRWPGAVYDGGAEPDPRFSLANERTFLAWIRTSLALVAGGVAVHALADLDVRLRLTVSLLLVVLGVAAGAFGFVRWACNERALRRAEALPGFVMGAIVCAGLLVGGTVVALELLLAP